MKRRDMYRSLEELADDGDFRQRLEHAFPARAAGWLAPVNRRRFMQVMGAALAMAGAAGCVRPPQEHLIPHAGPAVGFTPAAQQLYATTMTLGGYARGLLARSVSGRPIKLEGNPLHPNSLGRTDVFAQASVLSLYDPDRSQLIMHGGQAASWTQFVAALDRLKASDGKGLRILTETLTSPTLGDQLHQLLARYPQAKWHQHDATHDNNRLAGAKLAFGRPVMTQWHLDKADVIVSLNHDPFTDAAQGVRNAWDWAARRRVRHDAHPNMSRSYVFEPAPSLFGVKADHRTAMSMSAIEKYGAALAAGQPDAILADLQAHHGRSVVMVGEAQSPQLHRLGHELNERLGNVGQTVTYTAPVEVEPIDHIASLRALVDDMQAGRVSMLVILGGNPVYTAPADVAFTAALARVPLSIHCGLYVDETAVLCNWHLPGRHYLESWGDARAFDGTVSLIQPLISPLYDGLGEHEILAALLGSAATSAYDVVRGYWEKRLGAEGWTEALRNGVVPGTALAALDVRPAGGGQGQAGGGGTIPAEPVSQPTTSLPAPWPAQRFPDTIQSTPAHMPDGAPTMPHAGPTMPNATPSRPLELIFRPDYAVWDGSFANNAWLQECPRPHTRSTWDNAVLMSPRTAAELHVETGRMVKIRLAGREVQGPIWINPGQADGTVLIELGYGRDRAGTVGNGAGFNAYSVRLADSPWMASEATLVPTPQTYQFATVQRHQPMEGRDLLRLGTVAQYTQNPAFAKKDEDEPANTLYPQWKYTGYAWAMAIDLTTCIGCNACVVACQAENNSPSVGREEVLREREMHWIRIDRRYSGDPSDPRIYFQPVPCMHCENAPCELVCPVGATVHSAEGLNEMVYNRCVGTRYCSNNCPYKVRRFNFFNYNDHTFSPSLELLSNPDVTVRPRGVMEKCSYCVQRIEAARIHAEEEDRLIRDGEVVPACAQTCPTDAIVFGNLTDPASRINVERSQPLNYFMLGELNTRPRTTYLAALENPNPATEAGR